MPILQVISTSPFDSLTIEKAGADRIQLVSALQIGGITPPASIIRKSLESVDIPTMVMIRHHNNGFVHSTEEIELLLSEIIECKQMGVKGIVFGGITKALEIDEHMIQMVYKQVDSNKIDVTFHKAFDQAADIVKSYQSLCKMKVNRVLTQGGTAPIANNFSGLKHIIEMSKVQGNTEVLLGGGITLQNVSQIINGTSPSQIHIGTCVRKDKFGPVLLQKVFQFVQLIKL